MKRITFPLLLLLILTLGFQNCQKNQSIPSPVVAQVGQDILTLDELNKMTPENLKGDMRKSFQKNYIDSWVERKLLLNYAIQNNIRSDSVIELKTKQFQEELIIEKLKDILLTSSLTVSEAEITDYYEHHKEEFKIDEDEVHLIMLRLESRNIGIEDDIKNASSLMEVIKKNFLDKPLPYQLEPNGDLGYVPISQLKPIIARAIKRTPIGKISRRLKTADGIYYFQVLDYKKKGSYKDLVRVKNDIRLRILHMKLAEKLKEIEVDMGSKLEVQKFLNKIN